MYNSGTHILVIKNSCLIRLTVHSTGGNQWKSSQLARAIEVMDLRGESSTITFTKLVPYCVLNTCSTLILVGGLEEFFSTLETSVLLLVL